MSSDAPLEIIDAGAVTAVGLSAAQTCAAIRAGIKRLSPLEAQILDYEEPRVGARVSADPRMRIDEALWLLNLAGRALLDCAPTPNPETVVLWLVPEEHRRHPLCTDVADSELLARFEAHVGRRFSPDSRVLRNGAAGCIEALGLARDLLRSESAKEVVIGAADSLLRPFDLDLLARSDRLAGPLQSQGVVPGEGAAFLRVGLGTPCEAPPEPRAQAAGPNPIQVRGIGLGYEEKTVLGSEYSLGGAFVSALGTAIDDADVPEPEIDFLSGNFNGERYDAWEMSHAKGRGYPTRRERLPTLWPVASTGDIGVAGGVLALLATAAALHGEYAEGRTGAVQVRSDGELRGVALLR